MFEPLIAYAEKMEGTHFFMERPNWLSDSGLSLFSLSLLSNPNIVGVEDNFGEIHITFSPVCPLSTPERIEMLLQEIHLYYQPSNKSVYTQ